MLVSTVYNSGLAEFMTHEANMDDDRGTYFLG